MRTTLLVIFGFAVVLLSGAEVASAFISANTIDERATYKKDGRLLRVSGPIRCTRGERVSIRVTVASRRPQPARGAGGEPLHGQGPAGGLRRALAAGPASRTAAATSAPSRTRAGISRHRHAQVVRARKRGPQPQSRPDDRRGGRVLHGQQHR